jgi:hypothetical protein
MVWLGWAVKHLFCYLTLPTRMRATFGVFSKYLLEGDFYDLN